MACKIIANIKDREKNGKPIESIPAIFSDAFNKPLNSYGTHKTVLTPKPTVKKVPFYNWLEDWN